MNNIVKMLLLLAVIVCISEAQVHQSEQCLCHNVRGTIGSRSKIRDIQIYPETIFCNKVEIVVSLTNGIRICLDPKLKAVNKLMKALRNRQGASTARPSEFISTPGSISTARTSQSV